MWNVPFSRIVNFICEVNCGFFTMEDSCISYKLSFPRRPVTLSSKGLFIYELGCLASRGQFVTCCTWGSEVIPTYVFYCKYTGCIKRKRYGNSTGCHASSTLLNNSIFTWDERAVMSLLQAINLFRKTFWIRMFSVRWLIEPCLMDVLILSLRRCLYAWSRVPCIYVIKFRKA